MLLRIFVLISFLMTSSASVYGSDYSGQFVNRKNTAQRTDPRLKHFKTRKMNNCVKGLTGTCSTGNKDGSQTIRYQNALREKEEERRKRIRPWL